MIIPTTLIVIYNDQQILLGKKKRGFGVGLWNGYGGKVSEEESLEQAALRELEEESGITGEELVSRGKITFIFEGEHPTIEVNIYSIENYFGEASESEEMLGQWFDHADIPYHEMWPDDPFWLPHVLAGRNVSGTLHFDTPQDQNILQNLIESHEQAV